MNPFTIFKIAADTNRLVQRQKYQKQTMSFPNLPVPKKEDVKEEEEKDEDEE